MPQEKLVCSVVGENVGKDFHAKAWVVDSEFNGTSVLKFYADAQDWFEAVNLDLSYEYNEYVVGYVVTDKITGRFVNFQFKNNGALDYGLEGEETYKAFEEKESLKQLSIGYAHMTMLTHLRIFMRLQWNYQRRVRLSPHCQHLSNRKRNNTV